MPGKTDKPRLTREQIAQRAALELPDGAYVNLGWGIPNLISDYLPAGVTVFFHSENGILGMGRRARAGEEDFDLVDAMKVPVTLVPGASFFNQADAHLMTRGGHLDVAVLGGFQVSEKGDLANWKIPGAKGSGGIGGAMDIASGTKTVVVCMEHTTRDGAPKIVRECSYPLTGLRCVTTIVTDLAVIDVTPDGLALREVAPQWTAVEVQQLTGATLNFAGPPCRIAPEIKMRSTFRIRIARSLRVNSRMLVCIVPRRRQRNARRRTRATDQPKLTYRLTYSLKTPDLVHISIHLRATDKRAPHTDHSPLCPRRIRAAPVRSFRLQRQSLLRIRAACIHKRRCLVDRDELAPRWIVGKSLASSTEITRIEYDIDVAKMERDIFSAADTSKIREGYVGLLGYSIFAFIEGREDLTRYNSKSKRPKSGLCSPRSRRKLRSARTAITAQAANYYALADSQITLGPKLQVLRNVVSGLARLRASLRFDLL